MPNRKSLCITCRLCYAQWYIGLLLSAALHADIGQLNTHAAIVLFVFITRCRSVYVINFMFFI